MTMRCWQRNGAYGSFLYLTSLTHSDSSEFDHDRPRSTEGGAVKANSGRPCLIVVGASDAAGPGGIRRLVDSAAPRGAALPVDSSALNQCLIDSIPFVLPPALDDAKSLASTVTGLVQNLEGFSANSGLEWIRDWMSRDGLLVRRLSELLFAVHIAQNQSDFGRLIVPVRADGSGTSLGGRLLLASGSQNIERLQWHRLLSDSIPKLGDRARHSVWSGVSRLSELRFNTRPEVLVALPMFEFRRQLPVTSAIAQAYPGRAAAWILSRAYSRSQSYIPLPYRHETSHLESPLAPQPGRSALRELLFDDTPGFTDEFLGLTFDHWEAMESRTNGLSPLLADSGARVIIASGAPMDHLVGAEAAHRAGIPVVTLPHGMLQAEGPIPPDREPSRWSEIRAVDLLDWGADPRITTIKDAIAAREYGGDRRFVGRADDFVVLVLTEPWPYQVVPMMTAFLQQFLRFAESLPDHVKVVFKPHPSQDGAQTAALLGPDLPSSVTVLPRDSDLFDALNACKLVVSLQCDSSAAVHAILARLPVAFVRLRDRLRDIDVTRTSLRTWRRMFLDAGPVIESVRDLDILLRTAASSPQFLEGLRQRVTAVSNRLAPVRPLEGLVEIIDQHLLGT